MRPCRRSWWLPPRRKRPSSTRWIRVTPDWSATARSWVSDGEWVTAGTQLTEGSSNPQDILRVMGRENVQLFLVEEVQKVYRTQGVNINDKHIEVIVRQMLRKVRVDTPGDTDL